MATDEFYKRFFHCFTCKKSFSEEAGKSHIGLGHQVESYLCAPDHPRYDYLKNKNNKEPEVP